MKEYVDAPSGAARTASVGSDSASTHLEASTARPQSFASVGAAPASSTSTHQEPWDPSSVVRYGVLAIACIGFSYWAYSVWRDARFLFDDAFISFRYAYNFAHGQGLVYNRGEYVEGYTNFAWVLIAALSIVSGLDPTKVMPGLGFASYSLSIGLCAALILRHEREFRYRDLLALSILPLLILPEGVVAFSGTGLETPFVGLLVLLAGLINHLWRPKKPWKLVAGGFVMLLAVLTRMDSILAAFVSGVVMLVQERIGPRNWRAPLSRIVITFTPLVLGLAIYLVWKQHYYGQLLPNTYYAKAAHEVRYEVGQEYLKAFCKNSPQVLVLMPLALFGTFGTWRTPRFAFGLFAGVAVALHVFYVARVGGDFMEYRFMWEYWPLFVAVCSVGMIELLRRSPVAAIAVVPFALSFATWPRVLESKYYMQTVEEMGAYGTMAKTVGKSLDRALPPDTIVAVTLAGLGYFAPKVTFIDQWGLNDAYVAHLPLPTFGQRGHLKFAPEAYLRARKVNLFMAHPAICSCANPCLEDKPDVFIKLGQNDECLRTWYLTQTEALTRFFCAHPERFLVKNVTCPAK